MPEADGGQGEARGAPTRREREWWDPFEGTVPHRVDAFAPSALRWTPRRKLMLAGCVAGFPIFVLSGPLSAPWMSALGLAMALGLGLWLAVDLPAEPEDGDGAMHDRCRATCRQLAERHGWSVRLVEPSVQAMVPRRPDRTRFAPADVREAIPHFPGRPDRPISARQYAALAETANTARLGDTTTGGRLVEVEDPAVFPAYSAIHPLLAPSAVAARPTVLDAVLHRRAFGVPTWTGVAVTSLDEVNPRRAARRMPDAASTDPSGGTLALVHGMALPGSDGVSATFRTRRTDALAPVPELRLGGRFDQRFETVLRSGTTSDLRQALTDELQRVLVAMHDEDDAEAMVHDGALFVRTVGPIPGSIASADALTHRIELELDRTSRPLARAVAPRVAASG